MGVRRAANRANLRISGGGRLLRGLQRPAVSFLDQSPDANIDCRGRPVGAFKSVRRPRITRRRAVVQSCRWWPSGIYHKPSKRRGSPVAGSTNRRLDNWWRIAKFCGRPSWRGKRRPQSKIGKFKTAVRRFKPFSMQEFRGGECPPHSPHKRNRKQAAAAKRRVTMAEAAGRFHGR